MSRKRRKSSSTQKYKIPASPRKKKKEKKEVVVPEKKEASTDANKELEMIYGLEKLIRGGKNFKGQDLTNKEITVFLTTISNLEFKLGVKHVKN